MDSGVAGVLQRRSEVDDVSIFNTLLNASGGPALFRATFGQYNFSMMIESSVSALIGVAEEEGKCLGFLAVNDSPSVSTENDTFLATVAAVAAYLPGVKATNTLFLNFFLVDETSRYDSDKVSFDLVRNAFVSSPLVDYIVWLCPSKVRLGFWMEDNFVNVPLPREEDGGSSSSSTGIPAGVKLLYMHRNAFMPKLLVRTARVEDNDDLLPILRSSNPQIVEGQSGFFLADLIQSQDQRNRFLVGVYENSPVGMLATSLDVNVALITKIFDIDCYHDIVVPKEQKPHPPPLFISVMGEIRSVAKTVMRDVVSGMNCLFVDAEDVLSSTQTAASSEEKGGEEEETKLARLAMTELKQHIARGVAQAAAKNQHPTTCVVVGFPRNDTEAHEMATGFMGFDILLELSDEAKLKADHDEDEADSFLRQHLDAVEALHSFSESQQPRRLTTPWYRVTLGTDGNTNEKDFHTCMHNIVEQRVHEVERILALEEEEPDRANAFAVTVFCVDREFQSRGDDLLRVAFEDNPKLDYCLYMVANSAPPTPLTSSMVLVKQRVGVTFDQTLYIVHRDAVVATDLLRVERLSSAQMGQVEKFSAPLTSLGGKARSLLHAACAESLKQNDMDLKDNPPDVSFVVLMGEEVVGIMTTSRACLGTEDVLWMRCNYHVDEVINFDRHRLRAQSQITNFVINPVYSKWTRYILREVMRKCMKSLLWFQNPAENPAVQEIVEELIPVAPRRRMQPTPGAALPMIEKPNSNGVSVQSPLFYLTKRQLTELKICIPKKIIVIGGGSASYAILEKLLFVPNLTLPNLQLVMELPPKAFKTNESDPSLEYSEKCSGDLSYDDADDPSMAELSALGLAHRISIVRGRLTDIDRANKAIVISDEIISEYNLLVIASSTKDCSTKKFPTTAGTHPSHCAFRGMFGLGDAASDAAALTWVRRQTSDRLQVIVYGHDLETVGAVGALLHKGVDPSRITAVISSAPKIADIAHPFLVESAVRNLRNSGVYIKMGFEIVDVQLTKFGSIESVQLQSVARDAEEGGGGGGLVTMNCYSLLCCGTKYCDSDVFAAINDSGIVFDGGVVVDKVSYFWVLFSLLSSLCSLSLLFHTHIQLSLARFFFPTRRTLPPTTQTLWRWAASLGSRECSVTSTCTQSTARASWASLWARKS